MADQLTEVLNVIAVIAGGIIGSALLTLFPYFMDKAAFEKQVSDIRRKPEASRTEEEKFLLTMEQQSFFAEYKFRFFFGLLAGVGTVLAWLASNRTSVETMDPLTGLLSGVTTSGFLTAIADKIRSSGSALSTAVMEAKATLQPR